MLTSIRRKWLKNQNKKKGVQGLSNWATNDVTDWNGENDNKLSLVSCVSEHRDERLYFG